MRRAARSAPVSPSGRPIPPPPGGAPLSSTGKPIPPPPGQGGRGSVAPRGSGGPGGPRSSGPSMRPAGGQRAPSGGGPGGGFSGRGGGFGPRPVAVPVAVRVAVPVVVPVVVPAVAPADAAVRRTGARPDRARVGAVAATVKSCSRSRRRRTRTRRHPIPEGVVVVERLDDTARARAEAEPHRGRRRALPHAAGRDGHGDAVADRRHDRAVRGRGRCRDPPRRSRRGAGGRAPEAPRHRRRGGRRRDATLADRPPVITVMGHVDHGKTKLLDHIRNANVVAGEAGGITQHIGAYQVVKDGRTITFIDTPGPRGVHRHAGPRRARPPTSSCSSSPPTTASCRRRSRRSNHAKAAEVPIVVAINKIDREQANPERVMQQLSEQGLDPDAVERRHRDGAGVRAPGPRRRRPARHACCVTADVEDLKANPDGRAQGVVLEAHLDVGRGPVATVLVQRGTLKVGDPLVAGPAWGRVRALINDKGEQVKEAGPSTPVEVLGLSDVADAGDDFVVAPEEQVGPQRGRDARALAARCRPRARRARDVDRRPARGHLRADPVRRGGHAQPRRQGRRHRFARSAHREPAEARARRRASCRSSTARVGGITQYDIQLAAASNATIIGFNVRPDRKARELAEREGVEIRTYEIIYQVIEDIENAMLGLLAPEYEEVVTGEAEVREVFSRATCRRGRRLLRAVRHDHPRLEGALPPRGHDHLEGRDHVAASASRTTCARCRPASSAVSACPTSRTSRPATSSRPTRTARSRAPDGPGSNRRRGRGCAGLRAAPARRPLAEGEASGRQADRRGCPPSVRGQRGRGRITRTCGSEPRSRMAVVSGTESQARDVLDAVERFVWSFPEVEVVDATLRWMEVER